MRWIESEHSRVSGRSILGRILRVWRRKRPAHFGSATGTGTVTGSYTITILSGYGHGTGSDDLRRMTSYWMRIDGKIVSFFLLGINLRRSHPVGCHRTVTIRPSTIANDRSEATAGKNVLEKGRVIYIQWDHSDATEYDIRMVSLLTTMLTVPGWDSSSWSFLPWRWSRAESSLSEMGMNSGGITL